MRLKSFAALALALAGSAYVGGHWLADQAKNLAAPTVQSKSTEREKLLEEELSQAKQALAQAKAVEKQGQQEQLIEGPGYSIRIVSGGSVSMAVSTGEVADVEDDVEYFDEEAEEQAPCPPEKAKQKTATTSNKALVAKVVANQGPSQPGHPLVAGGLVEISSLSQWRSEIASSEPVMAIYHATWCPHCKNYMPKAKQWAAENGVKLLLIDIDKNKGVGAADFRGVPATVIYAGAKAIKKESGNIGFEGISRLGKSIGLPRAAKSVDTAIKVEPVDREPSISAPHPKPM